MILWWDLEVMRYLKRKSAYSSNSRARQWIVPQCMAPYLHGQRSRGWSPSWHLQSVRSKFEGGRRWPRPCPGMAPSGRTGSKESPAGFQHQRSTVERYRRGRFAAFLYLVKKSLPTPIMSHARVVSISRQPLGSFQRCRLLKHAAITPPKKHPK